MSWSEAECRAAIQAYDAMLECQAGGHKYNKSMVNRLLRGASTVADMKATIPLVGVMGSLAAYSKGSIEFKMMNISAVYQELGFPIVKGYQPLANYQAILKPLVQEFKR